MDWIDVVAVVPLVTLLLTWQLLRDKKSSPWPDNKDIFRDACAATTLGIALSAFIRLQLTRTSTQVFQYNCENPNLLVTQLTGQVFPSLYLVISPTIVDGSGQNPTIPLLAGRPKPVETHLDLQLPETLNLRDTLDSAYPGLAKWLESHPDSKVTEVAVSMRRSPDDEQHETRTIKRECR